MTLAPLNTSVAPCPGCYSDGDSGGRMRAMSDEEKSPSGWGAIAGAAKPAVETACRLVESLLGKPFKVAGGLAADQLQAWRWANRVRIFSRAQEIIDEKQEAADIVPPSFLLPALEKAGDVEDSDLSELWSQLIAKAASEETARHPAFVNILQQLTPDDAKLLHQVHRNVTPAYFAWLEPDEGETRKVHSFLVVDMERRVFDGWKPEPFHMIIENLQRLGLATAVRIDDPSALLELRGVVARSLTDAGKPARHDDFLPFLLNLMPMGFRLLRACGAEPAEPQRDDHP